MDVSNRTRMVLRWRDARKMGRRSGFWPLIGAAIGAIGAYFGDQENQESIGDSNKASWAQLNAALQQMGWFGQNEYKAKSQATYLANLIIEKSGTSGQSDVQTWSKMLLSDDPTQRAKARNEILTRFGDKGINEATLKGYIQQSKVSYNSQDPTLTAFGGLKQSYDSAKGQLQKGNAALLKGYQKAAGEINDVGRFAQSNIIRQGKQSLAQQQAGLAQSGLLNTSIRAQLMRANQADVANQTTGLATQFAPLRAQAAANIGEAQFRGAAGLAGLSQSYGQQQTHLAMSRISALMGVEHVPQVSNINWGQLGQQWGTALQQSFGGS